MSMQTHSQLATDMQSLTLEDRAPTPRPHDYDTHQPPAKPLVDCRPWPPEREVKNYRGTGVLCYGIYLRGDALADYALRRYPRLAGQTEAQLILYGLDSLRLLVNDQSLSIQIVCLRERHKKAMPFITDKRVAPILSIFILSEENYKNRLTAENVEKLVDALDCRPDWFEISFAI